jgi:hypothetical protein
MQHRPLLILLSLLFSTGCLSLRAASTASATHTARPAQQFKLTSVPKYPNAGLSEYVLISDNLERDRANAEAVIQTKVELVRAMHTKLREHFEPSLATDFVFRAEDQFFDRDAYINDRVSDSSKVKRADYRNVVVRFIGNLALVTYSNIVEDEPGGPGAWKAQMIWADILAQESGRWKFQAMHLIEFRDLTTAKR